MSDTTIAGFRKEFVFLSNFYPCTIACQDTQPDRSASLANGQQPYGTHITIYNSVEHMYQAAKPKGWYDSMLIAQQPNPALAQKAGRKVVARVGWDATRIPIMQYCLRAKFYQNPELRGLLLGTGSALLEEENWWGDRFWGTCGGIGMNYLGILLMEIRDEVRLEEEGTDPGTGYPGRNGQPIRSAWSEANGLAQGNAPQVSQGSTHSNVPRFPVLREESEDGHVQL